MKGFPPNRSSRGRTYLPLGITEERLGRRNHVCNSPATPPGPMLPRRTGEGGLLTLFFGCVII